VSYSHQNGDAEESPARTIGRDLAAGKIDAAIMWAPSRGCWWISAASRRNGARCRSSRIPPSASITRFRWAAPGEKQWKETLDAWINAHHPQIDSILLSYKVPLVDPAGHVSSNAKDGNL